jgi:hypothetical protein
MTEAKKPRRGRGEGGLYWDEKRQRFIAEVTTGYAPAGKRIVRRGSGKTKIEARAKLKEVLRDHEDGLAIAPQNYTAADAVNDWLTYGLNDRSRATIAQVHRRRALDPGSPVATLDRLLIARREEVAK